jgi:drug/metabolite transporter (DMT)-like permease
MMNRGIVFGIAASAIWGGMYVVSKIVLEVIPPFTLLAMRLALGIISLWVLQAWKAGAAKLARKQWRDFALVGLLGYGISLGFQFTGTHLSTVANGAVITAATPAFVFIFARLILGEKLSLLRILALALSTLGVLAVVDPALGQLDSSLLLGNLLLVGAAVTWAVYSVLVRRVTSSAETFSFTLVALVGGLLVALPAAAIELNGEVISRISLGVALGVLYLGVASTALAAYLWNKAFALVDAGTVSLTFFVQPLVGASLGALVLNEELSSLFILGAILILVGLFTATREDKIAPETP